MVGKGAEWISLALFVTLVPRLLGAAAYGEVVIALTLVRIASSSVSLGGPTLVTRYVPAAALDRRAAVARSLAVRLAAWRTVQVLVLAALTAGVLGASPGTVPVTIAVLVLVAIAFDVAATLALQSGLALGHVGAWSFRWPLQNATMVVAIPILYAGAGSTGAVAGLVVASGVALCLGLSVVAGELRRAPRGAPIPTGALRFGALQGLSGVSLQVVNRGAPVAVVILGGTAVAGGHAGLAVGVALAVTLAVSQAFTVQLPLLSERVLDDPSGAEADAARLAWRSELLLLPAAVIAALAVDPLLAPVVGGDFAGAADAFGPALALLPLAPVAALATQVAALRLRPLARLWTTLTGAVAFCAAAIAAVPAWGAAGATTAMLAGTAAMAAASVVAFPGLFERRLLVAATAGAALVVALGLLT